MRHKYWIGRETKSGRKNYLKLDELGYVRWVQCPTKAAVFTKRNVSHYFRIYDRKGLFIQVVAFGTA